MSTLPIVAAAVLGSTASLAVVLGRKTSSSRKLDWADLVRELEPVNSAAIERVARDYLTPVKGQLNLEPGDLWEMVGGLEGIERMRANARVICALAAYAERWNFDEAVVVTERIRREAVVVRRAARHILLHHYMSAAGRARVPFYIQEAATSYHLMRTRLLALYETSHEGRYPALARAL